MKLLQKPFWNLVTVKEFWNWNFGFQNVHCNKILNMSMWRWAHEWAYFFGARFLFLTFFFLQRFKEMNTKMTERVTRPPFSSLSRARIRITELITFAALCFIIKRINKHQKRTCLVFQRKLPRGEKCTSLFNQNMLITKEYSKWCEACKTYFQNKASRNVNLNWKIMRMQKWSLICTIYRIQ